MVKRCPGQSAAMVTQVTNLATAALKQRLLRRSAASEKPAAINGDAATGELSLLNRKFLDDRVCQKLGCEFGHLAFGGWLGQFEFKPLALADAGHLAEAEAPARAGDRITLRVMDLGLEHHVDDDLGHTGSVREARPSVLRLPTDARFRRSRDRTDATNRRLVVCLGKLVQQRAAHRNRPRRHCNSPARRQKSRQPAAAGAGSAHEMYVYSASPLPAQTHRRAAFAQVRPPAWARS